MKKILSLFLLALIVVAAIVFSRFNVRAVEAQQSQNRLQHWEYASVYISLGVVRKNSAKVYVYTCYFQDVGNKRESFELEGEPVATWGDATAKALSRLGNEGWEMMQLDNHGANGALTFYFKRPKTVSR